MFSLSCKPMQSYQSKTISTNLPANTTIDHCHGTTWMNLSVSLSSVDGAMCKVQNSIWPFFFYSILFFLCFISCPKYKWKKAQRKSDESNCMNEEKEQNTRKNVKHTKLVIGLANKQLGYTHARASGSNGHRYTFLMWTRHAIPRNTHVQTDHTYTRHSAKYGCNSFRRTMSFIHRAHTNSYLVSIKHYTAECIQSIPNKCAV